MTTPNIDLADKFLTTMLGTGDGWLFLGYKEKEEATGKQDVFQKSFRYPGEFDDALGWIERMADDHPIYWCPLPRTTRRRKRGNAATRRLLWLDLDGPAGDEGLLQRLKPIVVTSGRPGHRHIYVPLRRGLSDEDWHAQARGLRDAVGGKVDNKIADNDFLRVPGSLNFRTTPPTVVDIETGERQVWNIRALRSLVRPARASSSNDTAERVTGTERVSQASVPRAVRDALRIDTGDRSEDFYRLVVTCKENNLSANQTASLLQGHPSAERYEREGRLHGQVSVIRKKNPMPKKATPAQRLKIIRASEIRPKRQKWLVPDRIPLGALTLVGGREGSGKSSICVDYAARVTRGELDGELNGQPKSVIYFATEDDRSTILVPRLMVAGADLSRVIFLDPESPEDDLLNLPSDNDELDYLIEENDVGLVVLDPILSALDGTVNDTNPRELRRELEPINQMAARRDCSFLGIAHFNKRESNDIGVLMSGLLVWSQVSRATIGVIHDPDDPDPDSFIMSNGKNNTTSRSTSSLRGRLVGFPVETDDGVTQVSRVEWLGESEVSVSDVMSTDKPKKNAERWLVDLLAERGPMTRPEIIEIAESTTTFSRASIDRAKKTLDLESVKGFGGAAKWSLPSDSHGRSSRSHEDTENIDNIENVGGTSTTSSSLSTSSTLSTLSGVARARSREEDDETLRPAVRKSLDFGKA